MSVSISKILKDNELSLKQFSKEAIKALENRIQEEIAILVKESFECKRESKLLLQKAKLIVEKEIDEDKAVS